MSGTAKAEIEIVASTSKLPAALREAGKMVESFALGVGRVAAGIAKPMLDIGKRALGNMLGGLATRGLDFMVEQGKSVLEFEEALVRFGISARKTPAEMRQIADAARSTSTAIGVNALDVLNAGRAYVDLAGAENFSIEKMNILARAAQATGSKTEDLAGMMYQLTTSMKVPDSELENTMGGLINQAKDGAIEAKQMASEFAGILPLFKRFGVIGREGTIQAGAMFQIMRDGANSAGEAGTMLQRVYAGIQSYAPRFEAQGVQIYEKFRDSLGRKVLLPFPVIFKNIVNSEAMKDPALVKKMFGRTEGWRGMLLGDEAARAMDKVDASGEKAISRLMALENAGRENNVIQRDLATYTESSSGKIAIAVEKMKNAVAVAFTPERVAAFADALTHAAGAFMDAAHWIDSHSDITKNPNAASDAADYMMPYMTNTKADPGNVMLDVRAREYQNYKMLDAAGNYHPVPQEFRQFSTGMQTEQAINEVGERLGRMLAAKGDRRGISAGMMVRQEEGEAAGKSWLRKQGYDPDARSAPPPAATQAMAAAVRDALAPALDRLTRVLAGDKITEVKVGETSIAKAVDNASSHGRK